MKKITERKRLIKKLDDLWAKKIKERDGFTCQRCKSQSKRLNACHFYGRRNKTLRWDLDDGVTLCVGCHFWAHSNPAEFTEWFKEWTGEETFERLQTKKNNKTKTDLANLKLIYLQLQ